jgi:hypothetical protein
VFSVAALNAFIGANRKTDGDEPPAQTASTEVSA